MINDVLTTRSLKNNDAPKDSNEIWAVGSIDEANAIIGLAKVHSKGKTRDILAAIQKKMFYLGAEISSGKKMIHGSDVEQISELIREYSRRVRLPKSFIVLEQDQTTAYLSIARTAVRRAERWIVRIKKEEKVGEHAVEWINKLSYLLYLLILSELNGDYEPVEFEKR